MHFLLLCLLFLLPPPPLAASGVVVLHTNDCHGQLHPTDPPEDLGGVLRRTTLIRRERQAAQKGGKEVLLLDAGDLNTGTFLSDQHGGLLDLDAMETMGYDAMTVGNHEFDLQRWQFHRFRLHAAFPLLSANLRNAAGNLLFRPWLILPRGGFRVGIIGLTTAETPTTSTFGKDYPWTFSDPAQELEAALDEIESRCDFLVVLSHLGREDDLQLITRFGERIHAWVGGHTHEQVVRVLSPRSIYSRTGSKGRWLGRFELGIRSGQTAAFDPRVIPVSREIPPDPDMLRLIPPADKGEVLGHCDEKLSRSPLGPPGSSSLLGNFYCDALRSVTGTDLAISNKGALRRSLPAGDLTDRQLYGVTPFKNATYVFRLTGSQIQALFANCMRTSLGGSTFLEVSGATVRFEEGKLTIQVHGADLAPKQHYTLAVADFLAKGGDGYVVFQSFPPPEKKLPLTPFEVFKTYLRNHPEVHPDPTLRILAPAKTVRD
jgi:5'-nucleotidase/UDP-sugar diphosphatase